MVKGVIFDLDGVICFTDHFHYLAWKKLADREGIYFDEKINNRLRGVSRMDSLEIILEKANKTYSDAQKQEMAAFKNNVYKEFLLTMNRSDLSEDVKVTLLSLKDKGIKIAIGSSSKNAKTILKQLNILDWFDVIIDGNDISHSKPDPEVFIKAQIGLKLLPTECFVVEDSIAGIDASNKGGIPSVAIGDACKYDNATYKIKRLIDILNLI